MTILSGFETSELAMERVAAAAREEGGPEGYAAWLDALTRRAAQSIGLETSASIGERETEVDVSDVPAEVLREPHALGWFHQHFGEAERAASHRAHHRREAKHQTAAVTTQLYTPRWIADVLVERALRGASSERPTVLDPAVGGGQMLLAAYDALERRRPEAEPVEHLEQLRGIDIDARAVEVARRSLKLHVARRQGERSPAAEETIDRSIRVGDGLFDEVDTAGIVLTNPPYMGMRSMPAELKDEIRQRFEPFHRDLYAAFIRRCLDLAEERIAILAQQTIWYLKSFRRARERLLAEGRLDLFVHFGPHAFRTLDGEKANVVAFVQAPGEQMGGEPTTFWDLRDLDGPSAMMEALAGQLGGRSEPVGTAERRTRTSIDAFGDIPGRPLAYWLPEPLRRHFRHGRTLGDIAEIPGCQNKTGDNRTYVRDLAGDGEALAREGVWRRPLAADPERAPMRSEPPEEARWIPYSKGGRYAPWWGNWEHFVDWSEEARDFYRENSTSNLVPERYRFRQGICYTDFGGDTFNARWMPPGVLFDMAGPAIFPVLDGVEAPRRRLFAVLGLLNTTPVRELLNGLNPSIHYQVTDLRRLPIPEWSAETERRLAELAVANVRDVRRAAAAVEGNPVSEITLPEADVAAEDVANRCRDRERAIERIALDLYGLDPETLEPLRGTHRLLSL